MSFISKSLCSRKTVKESPLSALFFITKSFKQKWPNIFRMQCLPFLFRAWKRKEINKQRKNALTNVVKSHLYLHSWLNTICIKWLMHWFHVLWNRILYYVEFRSWFVLSSAITHYFLSKLTNQRKLNNAFINDLSRSYWGKKRNFFLMKL